MTKMNDGKMEFDIIKTMLTVEQRAGRTYFSALYFSVI
jgi:hypothetical protein